MRKMAFQDLVRALELVKSSLSTSSCLAWIRFMTTLGWPRLFLLKSIHSRLARNGRKLKHVVVWALIPSSRVITIPWSKSVHTERRMARSSRRLEDVTFNNMLLAESALDTSIDTTALPRHEGVDGRCLCPQNGSGRSRLRTTTMPGFRHNPYVFKGYDKEGTRSPWGSSGWNGFSHAPLLLSSCFARHGSTRSAVSAFSRPDGFRLVKFFFELDFFNFIYRIPLPFSTSLLISYFCIYLF